MLTIFLSSIFSKQLLGSYYLFLGILMPPLWKACPTYVMLISISFIPTNGPLRPLLPETIQSSSLSVSFSNIFFSLTLYLLSSHYSTKRNAWTRLRKHIQIPGEEGTEKNHEWGINCVGS